MPSWLECLVPGAPLSSTGRVCSNLVIDGQWCPSFDICDVFDAYPFAVPYTPRLWVLQVADCYGDIVCRTTWSDSSAVYCAVIVLVSRNKRRQVQTAPDTQTQRQYLCQPRSYSLSMVSRSENVLLVLNLGSTPCQWRIRYPAAETHTQWRVRHCRLGERDWQQHVRQMGDMSAVGCWTPF